MHGYYPNKDDVLARLKRIEGQIRGITRMVEADKYCIDILDQISAVDSALKKVAVGLLKDHLGHCMAEGSTPGGQESKDMVAEASNAIARLVKA
ncbi:MAG TPA: metal-sensitive transcriptional regulator [Actinomycetota bacterium]|nr:metal-sensitive transcriptional regulator [Actinomycetota bacterium]